MRTLLFISLLFVFGATAQTQVSRDEILDPSGNPRAPQLPNNPAEEMRYKAAVRQEEENHKETIERADEILELGTEIVKAYGGEQSLSRDSLKKLERMEKLARKIRGSAGGSDGDQDLNNPPGQLGTALSMLSDLSNQLNKCVKKTSRMMISGKVIESSNELIQLIKHIRVFVRP